MLSQKNASALEGCGGYDESLILTYQDNINQQKYFTTHSFFLFLLTYGYDLFIKPLFQNDGLRNCKWPSAGTQAGIKNKPKNIGQNTH